MIKQAEQRLIEELANNGTDYQRKLFLEYQDENNHNLEGLIADRMLTAISPVAEDCIAVGFADFCVQREHRGENELLDYKTTSELLADYKLSPEYKLLKTTNQSQISSNPPLPDGGKAIDWESEVREFSDYIAERTGVYLSNDKHKILANDIFNWFRARPEFQQHWSELSPKQITDKIFNSKLTRDQEKEIGLSLLKYSPEFQQGGKEDKK